MALNWGAHRPRLSSVVRLIQDVLRFYPQAPIRSRIFRAIFQPLIRSGTTKLWKFSAAECDRTWPCISLAVLRHTKPPCVISAERSAEAAPPPPPHHRHHRHHRQYRHHRHHRQSLGRAPGDSAQGMAAPPTAPHGSLPAPPAAPPRASAWQHRRLVSTTGSTAVKTSGAGPGGPSSSSSRPGSRAPTAGRGTHRPAADSKLLRDSECPHTGNPQAKSRRLILSGKFPVGLGIPPRDMKYLPESNPLRSRFSVHGLGYTYSITKSNPTCFILNDII